MCGRARGGGSGLFGVSFSAMPENELTPMTAPVAPVAESKNGPKRVSAWAALFWLLTILVVAGVSVFFGFVWLAGRTIDSVEKGMETGKETVVGIAEAFRPERISETFVAFTELTARGNEGNILEVATAQATESFTRKTNVVWFNRQLPLGTTVSEISVPATYRYHIDLNGNWDLSAYDDRVTVVAPTLAPSLPVAFDSEGVKKKSKSGWGRWDGEENLAELEKGLTGKLAERARAEETIDRVRDEARLSVAKFVQRWLLEREHWSAETYREIVVIFEDELSPDSSMSGGKPTLRLKEPPVKS